ncbi:hypothetical protein EFL69_09445 [Weissella confusa]|uniref:hypothetical protein n=1 Tax=Weissella confusa TaxID=1583 RepID=UPI00223A69F0|nr:hypothetical protein [Weissella confusa]MCS9993294.1 hypothetical protein [Weissella confusa]
MQTDQLVLAAINVVRQAFGHGHFITDASNTADAIHQYLASAASVNDDTIAIDVYEGTTQPIIVFTYNHDVFTYNHDAQIIAGETWTWIMMDEAVISDGIPFQLVSPDTVERLHLQLNKQLAHYAK